MRIWKFLSVVATLCCLMGIHALNAAACTDGQLYLEINLATSNSIQLNGLGKLSISEMDGLMAREVDLPVTITVMNPEALSYYAVISEKPFMKGSEVDTLAVPREYFAWKHGKLVIEHDYQYYYPESFSTRQEAENYAYTLGLRADKVMEMNLINSTVLVKSKGTSIYLETPLEISAVNDLKINGTGLGYKGDFRLKTKHRNLILNHYVLLDDYLAGVIQNEIGNNSPLEALKAQAVAARSHAVSLLLNNRHKADGYDLCNSTHCQVYKGEYLCNPTILQAVNDTAGEVLFIEDRIADATYHSSCGGKTDSSAAIWKGKPLAHLNGVTCIAAADSFDLSQEAEVRNWIDTKSPVDGMSSWERGALSWEQSISKAKVAANAGLNSLSKIAILGRGRSGRILSMKLYGNKTVMLDSEYKIRQVFGNLFSSCFYIKGNFRDDDGSITILPRSTLTLKGKGAGHGVGMCQVGTLRMARQGIAYQDILQHYYPGITISREWMNNE